MDSRHARGYRDRLPRDVPLEAERELVRQIRRGSTRWNSGLPIERDVIARGVFTSKKDLARKIRRYIDRYNTDATPFRWHYADPTKRIA